MFSSYKYFRQNLNSNNVATNENKCLLLHYVIEGKEYSVLYVYTLQSISVSSIQHHPLQVY